MKQNITAIALPKVYAAMDTKTFKVAILTPAEFAKAEEEEPGRYTMARLIDSNLALSSYASIKAQEAPYHPVVNLYMAALDTIEQSPLNWSRAIYAISAVTAQWNPSKTRYNNNWRWVVNMLKRTDSMMSIPEEVEFLFATLPHFDNDTKNKALEPETLAHLVRRVMNGTPAAEALYSL